MWTASSPRLRACVQVACTPIGVFAREARTSHSESMRSNLKNKRACCYIPHTQLYPTAIPVVDAIVILAGGQDESSESQLPVWVERRLDACASLLHNQPSKTKILCSGGGVSLDAAFKLRELVIRLHVSVTAFMNPYREPQPAACALQCSLCTIMSSLSIAHIHLLFHGILLVQAHLTSSQYWAPPVSARLRAWHVLRT